MKFEKERRMPSHYRVYDGATYLGMTYRNYLGTWSTIAPGPDSLIQRHPTRKAAAEYLLALKKP